MFDRFKGRWIENSRRVFDKKQPNEKKSQSTNYLNLTIDENGLIRWTGRLSLAPLTYETRLPILLDPYHPLTKLIILNIRGTNL